MANQLMTVFTVLARVRMMSAAAVWSETVLRITAMLQVSGADVIAWVKTRGVCAYLMGNVTLFVVGVLTAVGVMSMDPHCKRSPSKVLYCPLRDAMVPLTEPALAVRLMHLPPAVSYVILVAVTVGVYSMVEPFVAKKARYSFLSLVQL